MNLTTGLDSSHPSDRTRDDWEQEHLEAGLGCAMRTSSFFTYASVRLWVQSRAAGCVRLIPSWDLPFRFNLGSDAGTIRALHLSQVLSIPVLSRALWPLAL